MCYLLYACEYKCAMFLSGIELGFFVEACMMFPFGFVIEIVVMGYCNYFYTFTAST